VRTASFRIDFSFANMSHTRNTTCGGVCESNRPAYLLARTVSSKALMNNDLNPCASPNPREIAAIVARGAD
jgi:hypothetical protein